MKKLLFILLLLLITQLTANAALNWFRINPLSDDTVKLFVDISSIKYTNNYIYYLSRIDIDSKKDSMVCWIKSDCMNNKNALVECKEFDKNNTKYFDYKNDTDNLITFSSESLIYELHTSLCGIDSKKDTNTDKSDGIHNLYYNDGKILAKFTYIGDKLNGVATKHFPNGKIQHEAYFKDNKQEGPTRIYNKSGKLIQENSFKNDKADGMNITYYSNGKINSKTPFKNGKEDGVAYFYYKNGKKEWVIPYKNGKEDGYVVQYYKNGKTRQLTPYKNGLKDGYMTIYDNKGETVKVTQYKNDVIVGEREHVLGNIKNNNEINWGPYMNGLEEFIKAYWHPEKSDFSKNTEILFEIERNGNIVYKKIINSSGDEDFDTIASDTIKKAGRYKPLPANFTKDKVAVEFTFSYNVISSSDDFDNKRQDEPNKNILPEDITDDLDNKIKKVLLLLKDCDYNEPYKIIKGDNPTKKEIKTEFIDMADINASYANFDALGWMRDKQLYIYINQKHKNATPEALAALIAGRSITNDKTDSINEEIYAWLVEGYVWKFLTKDSVQINDELTEREQKIVELIDSDPQGGRALIKFVKSNKGYTAVPQESKGYTNKEFLYKFNKLLDMYRNLK